MTINEMKKLKEELTHESLYDDKIYINEIEKDASKNNCLDITNWDDFNDNFLLSKIIYQICVIKNVPLKISNKTIDLKKFFCSEIYIDDKSKLQEIFIQTNDYVYRDESELFEKPVSPSLDRIGWSEEIYESKREQWIQNAKLFNLSGFETYSANPYRVDALAQHYGFPTNFIDFTTKLGIAIYFALNLNSDKDFYVYALDRNMLINLPDGFNDDFEDGKIYEYIPPLLDKRLENQCGLFIKCSPDVKNIFLSQPVIEMWLNKRYPIKIFKFSNSLKKIISNLLFQMNIDSYTIFGDLNSLSAAIIKGEK